MSEIEQAASQMAARPANSCELLDVLANRLVKDICQWVLAGQGGCYES